MNVLALAERRASELQSD